MAKYLPLPNGASLKVPDDMGYDEALALAKERFPEAFAESKPAPKKGIMADIAGSASNLLNLGRTGLASLTGDSSQAAAEGLKRQQATQDKYQSGLDLEKITKAFDQGEYATAAGEAVRQAPSAIASLAPSIAQEMTLAKLGRVGGGALGAVLGKSKGAADVGAEIGQYGTTYLVNALQALGGQAQAKAQEQIKSGQKIDVDTAELLPYAGANAALNLIGTKVAMPAVFKKAIGQRVAAEADDVARAALLAEAQKVANRGTLETIGRGVGGFAIGELPTEILQDVVDRAAIGKPLADDEAIKDYRNTALTMLLAAPIGGGFGVQQRSGARDVVAQDETAQAQQRRNLSLQQEQLAAQQQKAQEDAAAQALEQEKQTAPYAMQIGQQYDTLLEQFKAQKAAIKKPGKDATPVEKAEYKDAQDQLTALNEQLKEIVPEYRRTAALRAQELEKQRIAGLTPEEYAAEQAAAQQGVAVPAQVEPIEGDPFAGVQQQDPITDYITQRVSLLQSQRPYAETGDYVEYLMQDPQLARQALQNRAPMPLLVEPQEDKRAQAKAQKQAENSVYDALLLQFKQLDKQQAAQAKQQAEQLERVRGQMTGAAPGADIMGAARQTPAVQAGEQQRAVDEARARVVTPEVEGIQRLGQTPEYSRAQALRQSYDTRKASEQQDENLVQGLLDTLPKGGMVTPGQVFQGLGGGTMRERSDLLTQLSIAREASGKSRQGGVKDNDVSRGIIEKLRALKQSETTGKGQETAPLQTALAGISVPEARAKEAAANKYADQQNQQLLALTRMLGKVNQGTLVLPDTFKQRTDAAKQAYFEHHANEIDARRDAFGLPPMAAWERGEARARVMEALNELGDRWGGAANAGPAGQRQFGSQVQAVAALQEQMRANIQSTVANAAKRANLNATNEVAEKTGATPTQYYTEDAQGNKKPIEVKQEQPQRRIAAPAELTLREEKQPESIENSIQTLLDTADTRQRAVPTAAVKPVKKVGSLADISQLLEKERSEGRLEPMSEGSISLLQKLQEVLPQTTNEEFRTLAGKIVRQIRTGNEPNLFDVRDLNEMSKAMEVAGQSETRPGTSTEELQRTSAQPQLDLFADDTTQTVRATPRNFQKLLDSKNVQQLRQAISKQNQDTGDELASVENTLTDAQTQLAKAEKATQKALDKLAALEEGADVGSSPLVDQSSEALATVKATDEKLKTRSRVAPESSKYVAEYGLKPTNKEDDEIKLAWAEATRDVVAAESALQALPLRIAYLTEIRDSVAGLTKQGKKDLVALIDQALRFSVDPSNPASMRDSLENREFVELKQWLDPEKADIEIKRLKTAYNQAKRSLAPARERLDAALAKYEEGSVVREALEREQKKAQDALAKAQEAERVARAAVDKEQKQTTDTTEETGTPNAEYRATLQRAREGLNLPGVRNLVDTTAMKQTIMQIRSAMGSYDAQLENKKLTEEKRAEIQAKRDDAARKLESVYIDAPRITSEIKEDGQLDLERAFDDAQAKAYDKQIAKRRARTGESPPVLPSARSGPVVKGVRSSAISQSGEKASTTATEEAGTALEKLAEERAKLADLERREKFLRDNGKAKSGGRLTPTFKALQASIEKQKGVVAKAAEEQGKVVAEVRATKQALGSKEVMNLGRKETVGLKEDEASIPKPPKVVFRTVTRGPTTLQTQQVENLAKRITEGWVNAPEIVVVKSEEDLPVRIRGQIVREDRAAGTTPGLFDTKTKKVYLIADNLSNANDVVLTIAHEVAGHYGLREMLGNTYTATMNNLYKGNSEVRKQAEAKIKADKNLSREVAVEEVLAEMAEQEKPTPVEKSALRQLYESIRTWLRSIFKLPNVTDEEVRQIVANARRYVIEGGVAGEGQAPEAGSTYRTTPQYGQNDALSDLARRVVAQPKSFSQRMGSHLALETEMNLVDMRAGLREALKAGAKEMGDTKNFVQAMYSVTKADQKMAVVSATLMNGPMELYTDAKGFHGIRSTNEHSAKEVFDAIGRIPGGNARGRVDLATTYMIAQRAANKGLTKLDVGGLGISEADLRDAMAAVNADPKLRNALEAVRTSYNAYNKGLIQFLASTGAIPKEMATKLLKDGDYVPFYRVKENGMADLVFSDEVTINIGDIRHQPYLAELKGGESKILPLTESLPRNTLLITDKALTNLATKNVAYAFQAIGEGKGRPDKDGKPTNAMPIHKGSAPAGSDIIKFNQEPDPNDPKDDGQRWVQVRTDDTIMGGIPAELIVKSLEGAHLTLPAFLKIGGIAGDILRAGVTRMPIYIARQLVRDPMAASFTGGLNYNPLTAVAKAGKEFVKMSRGTSEAGQKLLEKGLIQSGIFTGDPDDIAKIALQLAGNNQGAIDRLFAGMDKAAMNADAATRALVYDNAIRNGLSEVEADMATMESMNFYKRGLSPTVQYASRLIPFFNAQIQGLNVLYKAATGKMPFEEQQRIKQKFFNNALLLVGTGLLYAMAMEDDEYFRNAKPKDKYSNFFIPVPGVDEPLKLPIPYEAGWFFSLAVAAVDAMKEETDGKQQWQALRDMFLQSVPGYTSKGMPQIVKPAFEVFTNKNFFSGNNIESARMQDKTLPERFSASTTEAAKALSKALPMLSPVQIEHLANGYFGQLPLIVMGAANGLFRSETAGEAPEKRVTDLPFIGSSFQKKYGGADADVMYRMATESLQAKSSYESMIKQGRKQDAKDFLEEHRTEIAVAGLANQYKTAMGRLRADEERITGMEKMSAAEKRARIDKLDAARQDISSKFENAIKRAEASGKT